MFSNTYPDPVQQSFFYADVPVKRAMAWAFDTVLIAALMAILIPLTGFLALFFLGGLYVVVSFLYRWMGLARHSATMGMRLMGLEFRDNQGFRMGGAAGFAHTLFYALSVAFVVPQILSVLMICLTPRGQSLSDVVLGVVLVNRSALH
ncbi:MAG: RDD family protein [Pseudorhodobacter sp.]|nr:RDD family protein [Pseudorhodobacter sp.]